MEAARKARGSLRTQFSKSLTTWKQITGQPEQSSDEVHVAFTILNDYYAKIDLWNQKNFDLLLENNSSEAEISPELEKVEEYKAKFIKIELDYARLKPSVPHNDSDSVSQSTVKHRLRVRLPKIELYKFDGELANWLKFWSQFQKIHLDTDLSNEDKFQYLVQSMVPNTRANELVNSFPPTGENYGKAIETLKNRFGKNELLVEVYIRELLQLVITNMAKSGQKFKVSVLYDKLESHLRALESLNITKEACAPILYPLVESSLPEELLRAWQRHASGSGAVPKDRLRQLLEFLQQEVDNEERISMAMRGFCVKDKSKPDVTKNSSRNSTPEDIPTASALFQAKNPCEVRCIFCDENHTNSKCMKAKKMTLIERQNIIKAKKGCIKCMRLGHFYKNCKCFVKCAWCGGRHALLMCQEASLSPKKLEDVKQSAANISIDNNVYLQTLCVKLNNKGQSAVVRAIFDSGSQHSYILKDTASKLNYESCSEHTLQQGLFGGTTSKPQLHKKYIISVENLLTPFSCDIEVFDQDVICTDVTSVNDSNLIDALKAKNIFVTDFKKGKQPISLLIGADMMAKLCTNNMYNLECGISAIETKLGWTLLGRNSNYCERNDATLTVLTLHINQSSISNLWKLDTLCILDPIELQTQETHLFFQEVKENFEFNIF